MKRLVNAAWMALAALGRPSSRTNLRRLRGRGESPSDLQVREATEDDIPALAQIHVATWNATYAPFGARGPSVAVRERQWREAFASPHRYWLCLVVQRRDGELVGFAQSNRSDNPEYGGELRRMHLLKDYQRIGLGRRLIGRVARRFLENGITSMWLYGDARNPSSRAWRAMGAVKCATILGTGTTGGRTSGRWLDTTREILNIADGHRLVRRLWRPPVRGYCLAFRSPRRRSSVMTFADSCTSWSRAS